MDRMETGYELTEYWIGIELKPGYESTEKETTWYHIIEQAHLTFTGDGS